MRKYSILLITVAINMLLLTSHALGQANPSDFAKMSDFLPPSPNAAALGKYGGISVSNNTGLPSITIPLVSFTSHQLSFTTSLNYSSSGLKVDEISSRTGAGWVMNMGGVINRTVMGVADELATKRYRPENPNTSGREFYDIIKSMSTATGLAGYDSQPDIFSFNFAGYTGRFVFDTLMNPVFISQTTMKLEKNFFSSDWKIKITTDDGIKYFFGGAGATDTSKRSSAMNCGKNYESDIETAWYLKRIEHPNGDAIKFSYTRHPFWYYSGQTQTMFYRVPGTYSCGGGANCPSMNDKSCINQVDVKSVLLSEVTSSAGGKVKFYYTSRQDCGDKLISRVELLDPAKNTILQAYALTYTYYGSNNIPFLTEVREKSATALEGKVYKFMYNDPGARPVQLSYSQDHWGYFNGASNSTLIQQPADPTLQSRFPFATANRTPSFSHAVKGMLSSITYPTGGKDSLTYELNDYWDVTTSTNKQVGGLRVKSIRTEDGIHPAIVKKYYYAELSDLSKSSALTPAPPYYYKEFKLRTFCTTAFGYCDYSALYSNSLNSMFDFSSSPISYVYVVEGHGDNFENGGIQYKYLAGADAKGQILLNEEIMGATYSNFGYLNGKLSEQLDFKKSGSTNVVLRKQATSYKIDSRRSKDVIGWVVNRKYDDQSGVSSPSSPPYSYELECFDVMRYYQMATWVYPDTTKEVVYDQDGLNPQTNITFHYYDSAINLQLSRKETTDSKGRTVKINYKYPHNSRGTAVYDSMISRNMIAALIEAKTLVNDTTTSITQTNYKITPTYLLAVPGEVKQAVRGSLKTEGSFDIYDNKGNLLEFTGKDGVKVCYVWGYRHKYVVAKIVGTSYSTVLTKVDTSALQTITNDSTLRATLNNLRTIPNTLVTTISHKPLVGVRSETDPNNRNKYYEYDALGRMVLLRDHDKNIIKKICYNYYWQTENCNIYYNSDTSKVFTRQCPVGYTGSQVTYTVPAGTYLSSISQADANTMASAEFDANGQANADLLGTCTIINTCNSGNCSGVNKKCVNGVCETGIKVYTASVQIGSHLYECTYHYEWSDGSWSQNYTEQSPYSCSTINEM